VLTADFIAAVRRQAQATAQVSDADVLAWGDQEVRAHYLPMLRKMRAEYGVRRLLVAIANGRARIPDRAQVAGVRLVQWVTAGQLVSLTQLTPEDDSGPTGASTPLGWYFDAGDICVVPANAQGQLLIRYYQTAPRMLLSSLVAQTSQITAVSVGATTTTVSFNVGTTAVAGDIISAAPDHRTVLAGVVDGIGFTAFSNVAYTNADHDVPVALGGPGRTILVGDWVAPNQQTPFVPLPEELSSALTHRVSGAILRALGYLEESGAALELAREAEAEARVLLAPRSEGNPRFLTGSIAARLGGWRW
jgi:hypothetical protein